MPQTFSTAKMADGLQMGNLSLNESQHAPTGNAPGAGRAAYIPPHLRQRGPGPAPANVDPAAAPAGGFGGPRYSLPNQTPMNCR